jgi:filamentous hemagglutinin family protein
MDLSRYRVLMLSGAALVSVGAGFAVAGPDGGNVVGGAAIIQGQGTGSVTINQSTQNAIINWNTFNIGAGETTRFNQPNSSATALNRVIGGLGPSQIFGTLSANGRVFIINGDGILFGPNAVVNTAGFLATTNDIRNDDFMAGKYNFNIPGRPDASIVNLGTITASSGGFAALVAPGVRNSGTITATLGTVALAAGNAFTLDFYGDKLITLAVNDQIAGAVIDVATGKPLKSLVGNEGKLSANGGHVELTAAAARAVVDSVVNNTGVIEANSIGNHNGMIVLGAATGASKPNGAPVQTVKLAGKLSAAGKDKGTKGGSVVVTGESIALTGATIDASGQAGGGKVLIGGDTGGGKVNPAAASIELAKLESFVIPTATKVSVDAASIINASAIDSGNGGKVVLWSDQQTTFAGTILASGGANGGNGGFVETSSHGQLNFTGTLDLRAPKGRTGTVLLDPYSVTICSQDCGDISISGSVFTPTDGPSYLEAGTLEAALANSNVLVTTGGAGSPGTVNYLNKGDINVNASITWSSNNSLTLSAYNNINIAPNVTISNAPSGDSLVLPSGNLVLRADNSGRGIGTVIFRTTGGSEDVPLSSGLVDFSQSTGTVSIYYNPRAVSRYVCNCSIGLQSANKYEHPIDFTPYVLTNKNFISPQSSPSGQLTGYMLVNNISDLEKLGASPQTLGGTYALGRSFDASEFGGFASGTTFNGLLSGNGGLGVNYSISNLSLSLDHAFDSYGLFPFIGSKGTVRDLVLENANVSAGANAQFIGVLAGQNAGKIINVSVISTGNSTSTVDGGTFAGIGAGGLVGQNLGTITGSSSAARVMLGDGTTCSGNTDCTGGMNMAGGLVGTNGSGATVTSSFATGVVSAGVNSLAGGLVGANNGAIGFSYATGDVSITGNASSNSMSSFGGGLVGQNGNGGFPAPTATIVSSYATGDVTGTGLNLAIGGLVGNNAAGSTITDSKATGNVTAQTDGTLQSRFGNSVSAGGLVGSNQGFIVGSIALSEPPTPPTSVGGTTLASAHSSESSSRCALGAAYSCASGNVHVGALGQAGGLVGNNDGTLLNVIAFGAVTGAAGLAPNNNKGDNNNQTQLGGLVGVNTGTIGSVKGTVGFAYASGPVGKADVGYLEVGGFVAENHGSIVNSFASGAVNAGDNSMAGGFSGTNSPSNNDHPCNGGCTLGNGHDDQHATIANSFAFGDVSVGAASFAGGFSGTGDGNFSNTIAIGNVTGGANSSLGGLVGGMGALKGPSFITQSSAHGTVSSTGPNSTVGGLVGVNGGTIDQSHAYGAVSGTSQSYLGGLVGLNVGWVHESTASGQVTGNGSQNYAGGVAGLNFGLIDPTTSSGNVSSGANSIVGGLVGGNGAFSNFSAGQLLGSSFPIGTVSSDSIATGTASGGTGSTVGPQIGQNYPTAGLPAYPSLLNSCNDAVCGVLVNGQLYDPTAIIPSPSPLPSPPPLTSPPPLPLPPPPSPTTEAQLIQNLVQNITLAAVPLGDVVNTQPLNQTPPTGPGAGPGPAPGGLPPQFGARFFTPPPPGETRFVQDQVLLQIPNNIPLSRLQSVLASLGLSILGSQNMSLLGVTSYQVHIDNGTSIASVIQALASFQIVAGAQAVYTYRTVQELAQDPDLAGLTQGEGDAAQYAIGKLGLIDVHRRLKGSNISVAVIDSQIDVKHPDLDGVIAEQFDAVGGEAEKPHPHGTGMAGAIGSHRRLMGIAPSARLYAIHAFSSNAANAESTTFNILKAIEWASSKGVRVINMSFAGPRDPSMERALKAAHDKGIVLIAAAGNAGPKSPPLYPGADPNVIAVTATDVNDKLFTGANRGRYIAVSAPGVDILVPAPDNTYQMTTGTSVASAEVSGLVALLLERNPTLGPEDVRKILISSARRLSAKDRDDDFGSGLIDPSKAIQTAGDLKPADLTAAAPPRTAAAPPVRPLTPPQSPSLSSSHPVGTGPRPMR